MTVKELKDVLELMDDDARVGICVNEPPGWICPDGCVIDVDSVCMGIDWHHGEVLVVPKHKLDIHDVEEWSGQKTEAKNEETTKEDTVESVNKFVRTLEAAHKASEGSHMRFK